MVKSVYCCFKGDYKLYCFPIVIKENGSSSNNEFLLSAVVLIERSRVSPRKQLCTLYDTLIPTKWNRKIFSTLRSVYFKRFLKSKLKPLFEINLNISFSYDFIFLHNNIKPYRALIMHFKILPLNIDIYVL